MAKRTDAFDEESRAIIYEGANMGQLGRIFRMDHRVLQEKLYNCPPTGTRNGVDIWDISVAAPHLVKPIYDIETYIKRMHHNDLPKFLTKEFWAGQRSKQEFLLKEGDLWQTSRVVKAVGTLMKMVKMSVRLMTDSVDRQSELSDVQRRLIRGLGDSMLEELYRSVVEAFSEKPVSETIRVEVDETVAELRKEEDADEL